jgi:DNA-binding FrmR family transcriptional regulator
MGYIEDMKATVHGTTHEETLPRLRRIAGQVQGIQRMVEEKQYCMDILTQIQAARSALRAVELRILQKHMAHCVSHAFKSGSSKETGAKIDELLRVMKKQY